MTQMKTLSRLQPLWMAGIAALFVCSTPQAYSADFEKGTSMKVSYRDLDLSTADGVQILYKRIEGAARRVCTLDTDGSDARWHSHWRYCFKAAVATAVKDVNNQWLTAMYQQKHGEFPVG